MSSYSARSMRAPKRASVDAVVGTSEDAAAAPGAQPSVLRDVAGAAAERAMITSDSAGVAAAQATAPAAVAAAAPSQQKKPRNATVSGTMVNVWASVRALDALHQ